VQTQDSCANGGASTFRARTKPLFGQYRFRTALKVVKKAGKKRKVKVKRPIKKRARPLLSNLSLQISFSNTPNPRAGMAITKTSAKTAAACTQAGLKRGAGAFFFFASTASMELLFRQKQISKLRPLKAGGGSSGGVSAP
jgi:selenocysteine lyase/cysteine desulfurase